MLGGGGHYSLALERTDLSSRTQNGNSSADSVKTKAFSAKTLPSQEQLHSPYSAI
jgi:hypothetical protein